MKTKSIKELTTAEIEHLLYVNTRNKRRPDLIIALVKELTRRKLRIV
jgi:hypothetical protein